MEMVLYKVQSQRQQKIHEQGFGWNIKGGGLGVNQVTSGIEGAWTTHPKQMG